MTGMPGFVSSSREPRPGWSTSPTTSTGFTRAASPRAGCRASGTGFKCSSAQGITPCSCRRSAPCSVKVIEQQSSGAGLARNAGVVASSGDVLLFLDDDMEAGPSLLAEHERSLADGVDLVIGDVPLHPDSPRNLLSWGVGAWA